jgi:hypothetical protein
MANVNRKQPRLSVGTKPIESVWKITSTFPLATTPDPVTVILVWMSPLDGESDSPPAAGQTPPCAVDGGSEGLDEARPCAVDGESEGLDEARPCAVDGESEGLDEARPCGMSPKNPPSPPNSCETP